MSEEKHQPTPEEIQTTEELMTDIQKQMTEDRGKILKIFPGLEEKLKEEEDRLFYSVHGEKKSIRDRCAYYRTVLGIYNWAKWIIEHPDITEDVSKGEQIELKSENFGPFDEISLLSISYDGWPSEIMRMVFSAYGGDVLKISELSIEPGKNREGDHLIVKITKKG